MWIYIGKDDFVRFYFQTKEWLLEDFEPEMVEDMLSSECPGAFDVDEEMLSRWKQTMQAYADMQKELRDLYRKEWNR